MILDFWLKIYMQGKRTGKASYQFPVAAVRKYHRLSGLKIQSTSQDSPEQLNVCLTP